MSTPHSGSGSGRAAAARALCAGLFAAASVAVSATANATASEARRLEREFDMGDRREVRVEIPFGELDAEPGEGETVRVELLADCDRSWGRCAERIQKLDLEQEGDGRQLVIRVTGMSKRSNLGMNVRLRVRIPAGRGLEVKMGAGEVRVDGVQDDVRVHLGAGDVDIRASEAGVRTVDLRAGVGDASLRLSSGRAETARRHLVGADVHWNRGPGDAEIDAQVGAGDIEVRLE